MSVNTRRIYITHCSAKKNLLFKDNRAKVTPDKLYTATPTQRFINECRNKGVKWAIFSDEYGIWFSNSLHEWYEKDPNRVTEAEFNNLVTQFNKSLNRFDEIWFYHNPGRFHKLYKKLLKRTELKNKIKLFTHLNEITDQVKVDRQQGLSQTCKWLHEQLESLPVFRYPFDLKLLPKNGVYFFYEEGENSEHSDGISRPRIVRIGTHKENNFRSRISEHFLLSESKMKFTHLNPKPSDRSIFRKNIGRALLNQQGDLDYLRVWEIDYTSSINRANHSHLRNIEKEKTIESQIIELIRKRFYFRFISIEGQEKRMGKTGIESRLIGTVTSCKLCKPSDYWLGKFSTKPQIKNGKLWLSQHLDSIGLRDSDKRDLLIAIENIKRHDIFKNYKFD